MAVDDAGARPARPPRARPLVAPGREKRADQVVVAFDGLRNQRRWSVFLRGILLVPHLVWLWILSIGASVALVVGWFAALFTGQLPEGIAVFLGNVLQYQTRVAAYGPLLLTDHKPSLSIHDTTHSVAVKTAPGPLNRWAVLFRLVLMVPSAVVAAVVVTGAEVAGVVGWGLTLILGRMPTALYQANASVLRFQTRTGAFAYMLTAEQPGGLFASDPSPPARAGGVEAPESDVPEVPDWPPVMRLALSGAAKRLLVVFLVLGGLTGAAYGAGIVALREAASNATTRGEKLRAAHDDLGVALRSFNARVKTCAGDGQLACLHAADEEFAAAFDRFGATVGKIRTNARLDTEPVLAAARACAAALRTRAASADAAGYDAMLPQVRDALNGFDQAYAALLGSFSA